MTTSPSIQSSAPAISLATLRMVLAKGQAAHPDLAAKMERAARIVALRRIEPGRASPTIYWVQSEEHPEQEYLVHLAASYRDDRCNCPDYQRRVGPCKHAMAVRLLQACERAEERRHTAAEPVPFPQRTLRDDEPIPYALTAEGLAAIAAVEPDPVA